MPTKGWKRTWVKLFVTGWLHGSIRWQLEPDERSVWADLICLAGQCGHEGVICDNDGESLPRDFIANQFNIKQTLLDRTIAKSIHDNRLEEVDGCLAIVNWASYQSEYERQKPYRQKQSEGATDSVLATVAQCYEDNIGQLTPHIAEELKVLAVEYDERWVIDAIKEAANQNKRNLAYFKAILKRWHAQGRGTTEQPSAPHKQEEHDILFDEDGNSYYMDNQGMKVY